VHPRAAQLELAAELLGVVGPATDAVTCLEDLDPVAPVGEFACRGDAGEAGADD
jgi:hypothetical protein